jgi:Uma2 family endonuclease
MAEIQQKLYTAEELWDLISESDEYQFAELIDGELFMAGGSGGEATILAAWLVRKIGNFVDEHHLGYVTGADGHYLIANDPDTELIPDVGFVKKERMPKPIPKKFLPLAPDLAVEVVSPHDKAKEIRQKIEKYLEHGTKLVWIVYPDSKRVDIYRSSDKEHSQTVDETRILSGEDVLPNFKLSVKDIFAVLE